MRNKYDTIVVGGGFAGLLAAVAAAERGQKTLIVTKGSGSLTIGGGVIDLLGYLDSKTPVNNPFDAIHKLPAAHPYKIIGIDNIMKALEFFRKLTLANNLPYVSNGESNTWLPTAIGSMKPTFLRPATRSSDALSAAEDIIIVGVKGMKDFYPALIEKGLKAKKKFQDKNFISVELSNPYSEGRDVSALDIARYVDSNKGQNWLIKEMKKISHTKKSVILLPPFFGTAPDTKIYDKIHNELESECVEISVMPPSVTGLRLRTLLMNVLKKEKVKVIELAEVVSAESDNNKCTAIITRSADRERKYYADKFIIATGGFLGGGCVAQAGIAFEPIFDINLYAPEDQNMWSETKMFSVDEHLFGSMGVKINERLNPLSITGDVLFTNVHFIGRTIAGYDFNVEKSGNGVALVTAYTAGGIL